ncbi:hypothetical protein L6452_08220 [Arctium lappa]|uniref:Uncharacterized protein n=1 Tax=Arctium lappa TaxID=4217 RepID=A0ACB9DHB0_ARCLA|nr:hypothetical protein L6452_08220 [Arctium lappa]
MATKEKCRVILKYEENLGTVRLLESYYVGNASSVHALNNIVELCNMEDSYSDDIDDKKLKKDEGKVDDSPVDDSCSTVPKSKERVVPVDRVKVVSGKEDGRPQKGSKEHTVVVSSSDVNMGDKNDDINRVGILKVEPMMA